MESLGAGDPQRIGAYRLLARLGAGGMGQVYLARSDRGRTVAVKLVREELAAQEEFRARFRQEVQAARQVGGYWTAPVLDADTEAGVPWVATGYVAGPSLQQVVGHDHGALPERSVKILAAGLAHALKDIHAAGIVHRDLKPSNVLVTIDGPRVIDFGIARALETVTDGGLTRTGALVGSPGFMAPEQVRGDRITPACDVFCLGSILAYAATGKLPFGAGGSGVHALMFRIAQEEPDLEGVPEGIAELVRDCLKKDPAKRPTLDQVLERTGAEDTVSDGRSRDPWLPSALVAQLGRHAVQLLDAEDPEGPGAGSGSGVGSSPGAAPGSGSAEASPEHAPAPADGTPPSPGRPGEGAPLNHLPTVVAGQGAGTPPPTPTSGPGQPQPPYGPPPAHPGYGADPQTPPPYGPPPGHPAYGHPQQHPQHPQAQPSAYGYPQQPQAPAYGHPSQPGAPSPYNPYGGPGHTPPYGPGPGFTPPPEPQRRNGRSTAALVVVALVVALGAGGSVYALMNSDGGDDDKAGPTPTPTTSAPTTPGPTTPEPSPTPTTSAPTDGSIPVGYLGTWTSTIDNAEGSHARQLTIQEGEVGDTVLSLVADGPDYHCVFEADLTEAPAGNGPLQIGPSTVTVGEPASSCSPGAASEVTLLSNGTLERVNASNGEKLTYTKQ
ncbi:serine/threonine-protein kinase [Streptomyces sp. NBC_00140]|uniref:serine/threonine-protein kinase n=1 Tax=Streptomyces sp. NBC_00140 TaxID=2975664 RepID=UPI00225B4584|nr:serine/threonine-protein kinase [Streptomyces sp. NBC_00140]MCX5332571.1 serine/threonine protein kinase [Streptomyces sp. NBC_00140]